MRTIILLNGPPRSGKDTIGQAFLQSCRPTSGPVAILSFASALKSAVCNALGTAQSWNAYEKKKDVALPEFYGLTPRQAYIAFSELFIKPTFGKEFWGRRLVAYVERMYPTTKLFIVTDHGFVDELRPIQAAFDKVVIVRISRDFCNFDSDSRNYVEKVTGPPVHVELELPNNGTVEEAVALLRQLLTDANAFPE